MLPVYDKPYHKIKENMPHGKEHEILWNHPLLVSQQSVTGTQLKNKRLKNVFS